MRVLRAFDVLTALIALIAMCAMNSPAHAQAQVPKAAENKNACPNDDSGLKLPPGFCATVFADDIGHARQMVVAPDGTLYVNTWSGRYYGNTPVHPGGFLVALQDKTGTGKADVIERFGETVQTGGAGGTGIGYYKGSIYAESNDRIVRYTLPNGAVVPDGRATTIVSELPLGGDHPMHPFIIDSNGNMYVDVATATNSCQPKNRTTNVPGADPCTELETRGGIWRYDAKKDNQTFSPMARYATGIRNAEGLAFDSDGRLLATQHGRDELHTNWPALYKPDEEATLPSEELLLIKPDGDYGWPECYYDPFRQKLVLAPEYGGDGGNKIGVCATKIGPVAAFPAHWAPNAMAHYDKEQFPARYRNGVFIAFHGSWNRAPYAQNGYNVVFQPLTGEKTGGRCEIFADGFAGKVKSPAEAAHRPSGLAVAPDGSLFVSDDVRGRIYRIVYRGGENFDASSVIPCPSLTAPPGKIVEAGAEPPEGIHPEAGAAANRPAAVPPGATPQMVALGNRIFHGEVAGAACAGCHGSSGQGSPVGPNLRSGKWLWGDGSLAAIKKTITLGVPEPKQYRSAMPPMGGTQLTPDQITAVAAYVWSLNH